VSSGQRQVGVTDSLVSGFHLGITAWKVRFRGNFAVNNLASFFTHKWADRIFENVDSCKIAIIYPLPLLPSLAVTTTHLLLPTYN